MPGARARSTSPPLWHREIALAGAYAYGRGRPADAATFDLAFELVAAADLGRLVSATYPLARYEDAIAHAANAGAPRRGEDRLRPPRRNESVSH